MVVIHEEGGGVGSEIQVGILAVSVVLKTNKPEGSMHLLIGMLINWLDLTVEYMFVGFGLILFYI